MNTFVVSAVALSLVMGISPALAQEGSASVDAQSGVAVPKFINITAEARASCQAKCTAQTREPQAACVDKCVAALQAEVKSPREASTGQASGARQKAGECEAECRANNQGNAAAAAACIRACAAGVGAAGAKAVDKASPKLMRGVELRAAIKAKQASSSSDRQERKEKLQEKLATFKNKQKADIAARIAESLNKLNDRITDHFINVLEKLTAVMVRVAAGDVDGDGAADIAAANTAIAEAEAAVTAQAGKDYTVDVSTEAKVRGDVGTARQGLHSDLKAVEDKVKAARAAVRQAATHVDASVDAAVNLNSSKSN